MGAIGINGWQLIVQIIAFLIFVWLLWRFALGPIIKVLDERQDRIRESMSAAEKMQQELKETQARNEQALAEARREGQEIIAKARQSGDQMIARAQEEAGVQADAYLKRAQDSLRQETDQARQQLRQEIADLATTAAGRIIHKELDPAAQTQLIKDTLAEASNGQMAKAS
jgi:F-type H+-transporting ATPase subunit b